MEENKVIEEKILKVLDEIRPFLLSHGGNIEFVKYEDTKVYVKFIGMCSHCHMMDMTFTDGVEKTILNEVKEVTEVINIVE